MAWTNTLNVSTHRPIATYKISRAWFWGWLWVSVAPPEDWTETDTLVVFGVALFRDMQGVIRDFYFAPDCQSVYTGCRLSAEYRIESSKMSPREDLLGHLKK